jgi:hypothetical protein
MTMRGGVQSEHLLLEPFGGPGLDAGAGAGIAVAVAVAVAVGGRVFALALE